MGHEPGRHLGNEHINKSEQQMQMPCGTSIPIVCEMLQGGQWDQEDRVGVSHKMTEARPCKDFVCIE